ncbi:MAG: low specificity L-threonine aldolase [Lachnospiraceae bacterium]|nr:low specificity L-threonine aldolase [Lachnospiraceae bacterium]
MISFENDYTTGAHPKLLERLLKTNLEALSGYGSDPYCESACQKIRTACSCPDADILFLTGGTQTNSIIISSLLKEYEGVLSAQTGHVNTHEAGAIESTGHKVLSLPHLDGKIQSNLLEQYLQQFYQDANHEHMVFPGMLYISHPTEYGTLYSKKELTDLYRICQYYQIPLFIDGARLGYGLMSRDTDVTLPDLAALCDVFYIGGTKVGALCGEAVVFPKHNMPEHFLTMVKRRGALLAKGRLLGIQFDALFTNNLYFEISRHAIDMAQQLKDIFKENKIPFYLESPTNQQFVILENDQMEELQKNIRFSFWEKIDENHTVVRFVTSWSTTQEDLSVLAQALMKI